MPARCAGRRPIRHRAVPLAFLFACGLPVPAAAQTARDQPGDFRLGGVTFLGDAQDAFTIGAGAFNVIQNDQEGAFHQMPKVDRAWCPYCALDAVTHFATFAPAFPEALKALRRL